MTEVTSTQSVVNLADIANRFTFQGKVTNVQNFGSGNINDTFLVTVDSLEEKPFILQRINTQVFRQPELIMQNMRIYSDHVQKRLQQTPLNRRWEVPRVLPTKDHHDYCTDVNGDFWRAISFIDKSQSFDTMQNLAQAQEIGYALGMFHNLISDLPPETMADTLAGFHITPLYLRHYEQVLPTSTQQPSPELDYCLKFVSDRQTYAHILEDAKTEGKLPLRLMHGDPKINNIMFDTVTHQAVSVIDLDTVKPGLVHYDIGDCLRSGCNPAGEETEHWQSVYFDTDLCQGILQGYLSVAKAFLTENDYAYMYDAIRLIAFELGLRFFADYLAGNVYFKIKYPEHNLVRALVQFKLTESIESQAIKIQKIIQDMK
ncbi:phosphotransferase enzyme family protein [Nostoc sp. MS1]|uniref:phosphotransferase enzyme family protein n=1 Tax=Nostoc sp. MS1 TaxID=2764711 RepID=UPI001CC71F52|nr:aminoglycoside phosphotransferase family protein [Nostoc sp. MS1]BCL37995.1 mucin desulfatase [Nostoc sp. MS1]